MSQLLLTIFLSLSSLLCQAAAADDWIIVPGERVGGITMKSSENDLRKIYGDSNVTAVDIELGEGFTEQGTALFPNVPNQKLEIVWADKVNRQRPSRFQWTGSASRWKTRSGLTLVSRLSEIEKWNGKPFELSGFGWDYGGTVTSWESGKLESELSPKGNRLIVRLEPTRDGGVTKKEESLVAGDKPFSSNHRVMQKLNPHVYQLVLEGKR